MIVRGSVRGVEGVREVSAEGADYEVAFTALRALVGEGETLLFVNVVPAV